MTKPTKETSAGRAYLELRAKAKKDGRATDELLQLYALEGFLDRVAISAHAKNLVLKGGVLLAAYDLRRPTRDVDLLAQNVDGDRDSVLALVKDVVSMVREDGCIYGEASAETIREGDDYQGVRVRIPCTLAGANVSFHVDVNVGDPAWPLPVKVTISRLLGGSITVRGYPLSMIFAEKIVTAVQRGIANTRWRDFADVYLLSAHHKVAADQLKKSIEKVAVHRQATMKPLASALKGYERIAQAKWLAWARKQRLDDRLPNLFADVLRALEAFSDPVIDNQASGLTWDPGARRWV